MTSRGRTRRPVLAFVLALGAAGVGLVPQGGAASVPAAVEQRRGQAVVSARAEGVADVSITMSLFRYCLDQVCTPDQFGYVRVLPSGPTLPPDADNPRGVVDVRPGDRVTWIYNDPLCDFHDGPGGGPSPVDCPGHNVIFEDGSVTSPLMRARETPAETFSWTVPDSVTPGTKIPYYCEPFPGLAHYRIGMTGILRVV